MVGLRFQKNWDWFEQIVAYLNRYLPPEISGYFGVNLVGEENTHPQTGSMGTRCTAAAITITHYKRLRWLYRRGYPSKKLDP